MHGNHSARSKHLAEWLSSHLHLQYFCSAHTGNRYRHSWRRADKNEPLVVIILSTSSDSLSIQPSLLLIALFKGSLIKNAGFLRTEPAWEQSYLLFHLHRLFWSISPSDSCSPHPPPSCLIIFSAHITPHTSSTLIHGAFSFTDSIVPSLILCQGLWTGKHETTWWTLGPSHCSGSL